MVTESLVLWSHKHGYWTVTEYDPVPALSTECIWVTTPKSLDCNHSLVSFPDHFRHTGKNGLVNGLFHSRSTCRNVGGPIWLHCVSKWRNTWNNSDQETEWLKQYAGDKATQDWNRISRRLSGVLWIVGMLFQSLTTDSEKFECQ